MITLGIIALLVAFGIGAAHPKTRHFFLTKKEPKLLTAESSAKLEEWKQVFRETVISVEGKLSSEMEEFLRDDNERVTVFLATAQRAAEVERTRILKEAEAQRAAILKEDEESPSKRPLLAGTALKEFYDDK